jgi:hypothetical protein
MPRPIVKKIPKGFYEKEGVLYPRVTHVLSSLGKPGLDRWRGRLGNYEADKVANEARDLGTAFHAVAAEIGRGAHMQRGWQPPGEFREMAFAYIDWLHEYIQEVVQVEFTTYSEDPRYGGTLDMLGILRGDSRPSIIDVKTSKSPSSDWPLQLAAYRKSVRDSGVDVDKRVIIRIPKTGVCVPETYMYPDHDEDEEIWLEVLKYWNWVSRDKQRQKDAFIPWKKS